MRKAENSGRTARSVSDLVDIFVGRICPARVAAKQIAPRTASDYARDALVVKKGLGHIPLLALTPKHVADFSQARAPKAPAHVRNELALLSAALTYGVTAGLVPSNVAKEVPRPRKTVRERLITWFTIRLM